jgi:serine/threonine-protein kinase RsbW
VTALREDETARLTPSGYGITLAVRLPRDAVSVPVVRQLVRQTLEQVGVLPAIIDDIALALTEACANVLDHSGPGDSYDVAVTVGPERCELRVVDIGNGFDYDSVLRPRPAEAQLDAERGRGLGLMYALVDHIELVSEPEAGTLVRLVKQLAFDEDAPARRLLFRSLHAGSSYASLADATNVPAGRRRPRGRA